MNDFALYMTGPLCIAALIIGWLIGRCSGTRPRPRASRWKRDKRHERSWQPSR